MGAHVCIVYRVSYGVAHARGLYLMSCHVMSCHVMSCHLYTEMQRRRGHSKIQRRRGHSKIQTRRGQERRQDKAAPSSSHRATSGSRTRAHLPTRAHISPPHHTRCQEPEGISRHPHHTKTMRGGGRRGGGRRGEDRTGERRGERRIGWHVMACDATSHVMTSHRMHRHILSHRIQHSQHATHRGKQHATQGGKEHANCRQTASAAVRRPRASGSQHFSMRALKGKKVTSPSDGRKAMWFSAADTKSFSTVPSSGRSPCSMYHITCVCESVCG